jgi:multicomponent K+:H+ antiporter subunit A
VSLYIFLRGHNLPGGGFIAGLVTGVVLMLLYVARGIDFAEARLPVAYRPPARRRLALAFRHRLCELAVRRAVPDQPHTATSTFRCSAKVPLASALIFDVGVYLVVVGGTFLILTELGSLSRRETAPVAEKEE